MTAEERLERLEKITAPVEQGLTRSEALAIYGPDNMELRNLSTVERNFRPMADRYMIQDFRLGHTLVARAANAVQAVTGKLKRPRAVFMTAEEKAAAKVAEAIPATA